MPPYLRERELQQQRRCRQLGAESELELDVVASMASHVVVEASLVAVAPSPLKHQRAHASREGSFATASFYYAGPPSRSASPPPQSRVWIEEPTPSNIGRVHGFDPRVDDVDDFLENKVEEHVELFPWFHQLSEDARAALDGLPKDRSELILSELALKIHTVEDPSRYICEAATRPLQADPRFLGGGAALRTAEAARCAATEPPTTQWTSLHYEDGMCVYCHASSSDCACSGSRCRKFSVWRVPSVGVESLRPCDQDSPVGSTQVTSAAIFAIVPEKTRIIGVLDRPGTKRSATAADSATKDEVWTVRT